MRECFKFDIFEKNWNGKVIWKKKKIVWMKFIFLIKILEEKLMKNIYKLIIFKLKKNILVIYNFYSMYKKI